MNLKTGYQRGEGVPLHVKSLQRLQAFILQHLPGERVQVPVVEEEHLLSLLPGHGNSLVQVSFHLRGLRGFF